LLPLGSRRLIKKLKFQFELSILYHNLRATLRCDMA